jgi:fucose 4-O-acetylase-like acetyltransferase
MHGQSSYRRMTASAAGNGRLAWVDAAKGVGILLVIAGHVWTRGPVRDAIYAFHMPLFFLLSGYMVRPQPMIPLTLRQARILLIPFAAFSFLLIGADFLIEGLRGVRPIFPSLAAGIRAILFDTETLRGPFTILWFVPCLFFARLLWNLIALFMRDAADWRWPVLIAALLAGAHVIAARTAASPLGVMAVPAALAMFWAGQFWRARPPGLWLTLLLLVPLALLTLLWLPPVNLKAGDYGVPLVSLAGAAAVSMLLCLGMARLPHGFIRPLAWLGQASLVIMYVHVAFIHYGAPYFGKWSLFAIALIGSLIIHRAAGLTRPGRLLLLGQRQAGNPILTP